MSRSVQAAAIFRPRRRDGPFDVDGPDEDAFTLAIAAAERLLDRADRPSRPIDAIHLAGEFPANAPWGISEALGVPHVAAHGHGPGLPGLRAALVAGGSTVGEGGVAVVLAAATANRSMGGMIDGGAGAVALELGAGPGLQLVGTASRRHPVHRTPEAAAWVATGLSALGPGATDPHGVLWFLAPASPPVLINVWKRTVPGMAVVEAEVEAPGVGASSLLRPAVGLAELAQLLRTHATGVMAVVAGETTEFLGFRQDAVPVLVGDWERSPAPEGPVLPEAPKPDEAAVLRLVSEGAYLPRPRYVATIEARWRFQGGRCSHCGALHLPPPSRCHACQTAGPMEPVALPRSGIVEAATIVAPGAQPTEFDPLVAAVGAYGVALVRLAPQVLVTLQVTDHPAERLPLGSSVTTELRRLYPMEGEWRYGRKAVPVIRPSPAPGGTAEDRPSSLGGSHGAAIHPS
jgi:uncharacterized OB-fold protein